MGHSTVFIACKHGSYISPTLSVSFVVKTHPTDGAVRSSLGSGKI